MFLLIGALPWAITDVLDVLLETIWDPLDDVIFILIALSGIYRLVRMFVRKSPGRPLTLRDEPPSRAL